MAIGQNLQNVGDQNLHFQLAKFCIFILPLTTMGEFEKYFTEKGREAERKDTALEILKDGEKLPKIIKYSKLPEADVLELAKKNGLKVVVA